MMKQILTAWNFFRLFRLILGVAILVQGIVVHDLTSMVLGVFLGGMAVVNIGCCGAGGCSVNTNSPNKAK